MSPTPIHGVVVRDLESHADGRGSFSELFRQSWFPGTRPMLQANRSTSSSGVLRGMHYHRRQADYWWVLDGVAFVGLFDLRAGSPTQRRSMSLTLDAGAPQGLYIPPGVAHGFAALSDMRLCYLVDAEFDGGDEHGFAWNDPDLGMVWPVEEPILSGRDRSNPTLASALEDPPAFAV